jgi:hypothetical protein
MIALGIMYANRRGVAKSDKEAVNWYRKAADKGQVYAMLNLGWMYANGRGVARDDSEAVKWCRKAADLGEPVAMYNLGLMYDNGLGVKKDRAEALKWYKKAAALGHEDAKRAVRSSKMEDDKKHKEQPAKKDDGKNERLLAAPFLRCHALPVSDAVGSLLRNCEKVPLDIKDARKDAKRSKPLLATIDAHLKKLTGLTEDLAKVRYDDKRLEEGRKSALELVSACRKLCNLVTAYLQEPSEAGRDKVKVRFEQVDDLTEDFNKLIKKLQGLTR